MKDLNSLGQLLVRVGLINEDQWKYAVDEANFQAQEKEIRATGITLLSGTILPAVFLYILTALFDVSAVWWCYLIAQGLTLILSAVLYSRDKHAAAGTAA